MSKHTQSNRSYRRKQRQDGRLRIRSVRRNPPDLGKLARAVIEFAQAQAEADAEAQQALRESKRRRQAERGSDDGGSA